MIVRWMRGEKNTSEMRKEWMVRWRWRKMRCGMRRGEGMGRISKGKKRKEKGWRTK